MRDRGRVARALPLAILLFCLTMPGRYAAGEPATPFQRAGETLAARQAILTDQAAMARITTRWRARELYRFLRAGSDVRISDADRARVLVAGVRALAREQHEQGLLSAERDQTAGDRAALVDAVAAAGRPAGAAARSVPRPVPRFVAPAPGARRSRFGAARDPATGAWFFRSGVRIATHAGDPVRTPAAGVIRRVIAAGFHGPAAVVIDHGATWISVLWDLAPGTVGVQPGDRVAAGQVVARAGTAADGTGFELWRGVTPVDPAAYVRF